MTTKILTFRIPAHVYSSLCITAAELGVPVAAHVRRLVEEEHHSEQLRQLRNELLDRLDQLLAMQSQPSTHSQVLEEILLLGRTTAAHLNPQLVSLVRAQLANQKK